MLTEFGVNRFYVHDQSLADRGLTTSDLLMEVDVVDGARIAQILADAGKVLPF
jgi:sulfur relay (sulfurtransferase) DsrF/TusC family protein